VIYLDHNATHPVLPEVVEAMAPWWAQPCNPSSVHGPGQRARSAVESARRAVASLLDRDPRGIVFTSGATEGNATWWAAQRHLGRRRVALAAIEHPASRLAAEAAGVRLRWLSVADDGVVQLPAELASGPEAVDAVSLMGANHETGVVQPVAEAIGAGLPVHVDLTQAVGRVALPLAGAEAVVFSGHKLGGPPGVGVLSLASSDAFPALIPGAQERGRRGAPRTCRASSGWGLPPRWRPGASRSARLDCGPCATSSTESWSRWGRRSSAAARRGSPRPPAPCLPACPASCSCRHWICRVWR